MYRDIQNYKNRFLFSIRAIFFFNATATPEIYTLSLHDALPIFPPVSGGARRAHGSGAMDRRQARRRRRMGAARPRHPDRKSTRLNSSHVKISYAVFCLKKKKKKDRNTNTSTIQKVVE